MIILIPNLVFVTVNVMVKLVRVLGPTLLPPKRIIVGLIVVTLCHIRVDITHPWLVHTNIGPIIHNILEGRIIILLLLIVEVVLVLGKLTSTPQMILFWKRQA